MTTTRTWIVACETGEYSDFRTWPVATFASKEHAEAFAAECTRLAEKAKRLVDEDETGYLWVEEAVAQVGLTDLDPSATRISYSLALYSVTEAPWFRAWPVEGSESA